MIAPQYHDVGRTIENFLEQNGSGPSEPVPPRGMRVTGNTRRNSRELGEIKLPVLSSYIDAEIRAVAELSNVAVTSVDLHVVIDERQVAGELFATSRGTSCLETILDSTDAGWSTRGRRVRVSRVWARNSALGRAGVL